MMCFCHGKFMALMTLVFRHGWMDGCMSLSKSLKHPSSGSQDTLDVGHDEDGSTLA